MNRTRSMIGRRLATAISTAAVAGALATAVHAPAQAAPTPPATPAAAVHQVDQLGDLTYAAAFALGVQVYQPIARIPRGGVTEMVLQRVPSPRAGNPTLPKYAIIGYQLPAVIGSFNEKAGLLGDITYPIDPRTGDMAPGSPPQGLALFFRVQGAIGPFADAAVALPAPPA